MKRYRFKLLALILIVSVFPFFTPQYAKALKEDAAIGTASAVIGEAVGELHQSATVDSTQSFEQRKQQGVFAAKMAAMVTATAGGLGIE